jgi:hypothetical protein
VPVRVGRPHPDRVILRRAACAATMCSSERMEAAGVEAHGRRAGGNARPRSGSRETLKRREPHESIGLAERLRPPGGQRTPAKCEALKSGIPSPLCQMGPEALAARNAYQTVILWIRATRRARAADDKRVAGVERRHGFVRRGRLWRGQPHECRRHATRPAGAAREQAVRRVRNPGGGTYRVRQTRVMFVDLAACVC